MGVSDNAYLSLTALFGFLPLYLFKTKNGIQRYLVTIATFFAVTQCIDWINTFMKDKVIGIDSAFNIVICLPWLHYLVLILWVIVVVWYMYDWKTKKEIKVNGNKFVYLWLGVIAAAISGIIYIFYDCNVAGNADKYSAASNYILFNDEWGTHRGYIWRKAMECYSELSLWKKMIGYGPETFGILVMAKTANNPYNELFDSAHNEYLHMLVTVGIMGLSAYLFSIATFIKKCFVSKNKAPHIIAVVFGVICYGTQAFVNLNLPIVTPMLWLLLGIGAAYYRNDNIVNN